MRNSSRYFVLGALAALAAAGDASAASYELYTFGWYTQMVTGLRALSIVMNDPTYSPALWTMSGCGLVLGFLYDWHLGVHFRMCARGIAGMVITAALFTQPFDTVWVYDETFNRTSPQISVPPGIAVIAVMTNLVDRGLTELQTMAGDPLGPVENPSGLSANVMTTLLSGGITVGDQTLASNFAAYFDGCFVWYASGPLAPAGFQDGIFEGNTDLIATLGQAAVLSISPHQWYSASDMSGGMAGVGMPTCAAAWAQISGPLAASPVWGAAVTDACAANNFDASSGMEVGLCTNALQGLVNQGLNGNSGMMTMDASGLARQLYLAEKMAELIKNGAPSNMLANLNYGAATQGEYNMTVEWTPTNIGAVYVYLFAALPLLILFLPTALWVAILPFITGTFLYALIWHLMDVSLATSIQNQSNLWLASVQSHKLGLNDWTFLKDSLSKTLTAYQHARSDERIYAGVVAGVFGVAGGAMMEATVRGIAAAQAKAGSSAGHEMYTPDGNTEAYDRMIASGVSRGVRYDASTDKQVQSGMLDRGAKIEANSQTIKQAGGLAQASDGLGRSSALKNTQDIAKGAATSFATASGAGAAEAGTATGALAGTVSMGRALGYQGTPEQVAKNMSAEIANVKQQQAAGDGRAMLSLEDRMIGAGLAKDRADAQAKLSAVAPGILDAGGKVLSGISAGKLMNLKSEETRQQAGRVEGVEEAGLKTHGDSFAAQKDIAGKDGVQSGVAAKGATYEERMAIGAANIARDVGMVKGFADYGRAHGKTGTDQEVAVAVAGDISRFKTLEAGAQVAARGDLANYLTRNKLAAGSIDALDKIEAFNLAGQKGMIVAAHGDAGKPVASAITAAQDMFGANQAKRELAGKYFGGDAEKASAFVNKFGGQRVMEGIHAETAAYHEEQKAGRFRGNFAGWQKARQSAGLVYAGERAQETVSVSPAGKAVKLREESGSSSLADNTNVEKVDGIAGSSERHFAQVGDKKVLVSGSTDNTLKDTRTTGEGVTSTTANPFTGRVVFEKSEGGKTQVQHMDDKKIVVGTEVQGNMTTNAVKAALGDDAADYTAMGLKGVDEVAGFLRNAVGVGRSVDAVKGQAGEIKTSMSRPYKIPDGGSMLPAPAPKSEPYQIPRGPSAPSVPAKGANKL